MLKNDALKLLNTYDPINQAKPSIKVEDHKFEKKKKRTKRSNKPPKLPKGRNKIIVLE